jgi:hypothetical protein
MNVERGFFRHGTDRETEDVKLCIPWSNIQRLQRYSLPSQVTTLYSTHVFWLHLCPVIMYGLHRPDFHERALGLCANQKTEQTEFYPIRKIVGSRDTNLFKPQSKVWLSLCQYH